MRSSVSYMLSAGGGEAAVARPDWTQGAQHHGALLLLVRGLGNPLKPFHRLWERIQRVNNLRITDSTGRVREIWVRYVREHPVENNDWGDFQTHRRLLGLITLGKYNNQIELNEICRVHESLKVKYSNTLFDSRAFFFGPGKPHREGSPSGEVPDIFEEEKAHSEHNLSLPHSDGSMSLPCDVSGSISSSDSLPRAPSSEPASFQEDQNFTTPSNFKTRAVFYNESDPCADLEQHLAEFINSLFWILESKRLERSREKIDKVSLMLAPFEKKDIIGLDMESRNNKKRSMGRITKHLADLTLQAGLVPECLSLYHNAAETLKSVNDWLWLGASYEGLCAASAIILYPNLRNLIPLQRNASLQEGSPNKGHNFNISQSDILSRQNILYSTTKTATAISPASVHSDQTPPSSSDSIDTSSKLSLTDNAESDSLASSSDVESHSHKQPISSEFSKNSQVNNQFILSGEEIAKKYRDAILYYSNYKNAGIIETEAIFKAARVSVEQNNSLQAASFLQNIILINLTLTEQEKIQRFDTLSEMYQEIGFLRKAAFCQRLAATRQVSPNNPSPDWQRCYFLMLHSFPGHKLSLDPNQVVQHKIGWPALQIQLLQELVVAARRMGHPALATRHMTFLLQTMWPHLSAQERGDLAKQLQALSAQCEGGPVPLVLETGEVIPPANLCHIPTCSRFIPRPPAATRAPRLLHVAPVVQGPFLFTPIHFGSLDRKPKKPSGKMDYLWVENDVCEVQLKLTNPLPFELKVSNMRLLTTGIVFESIPETVILQPDVATMVTLLGTPKESGQLEILGYSTHTLGVKSNCRLKHMPESMKFHHIYTVDVIPSLPIISVETNLPPSPTFSNLPNYENVISSGSVSLYNGETTKFSINITNVSDVKIEHLEVSMQTSLDNQLQSRMFSWSNDEIQAQLPILPSKTASFEFQIHAEADFLDIGGSNGDGLFPNSLNSNSLPSRMSSPTPNQAHNSLTHTSSSLPHTNTSFPRNQLSASFRSSNSHSTAWSAPISVLPPTKGRQIDAQLVLRYSGGQGKDIHCRQGSLHINLELLPSVSITHWDVLPAEIPSQLYLVLDVTNLTTSEMALEYSAGKRMLLSGGEACRVPVPLKRCPLNMPIPLNQDKEMEYNSITVNSTNSIEQQCSEHISQQVDLRWHLLHNDITGKASVKGITLSQGMMDIVRMSPLNWEVSINSKFIKPQEEYNCAAGECVSLGVAVSNHFEKPLKKIILSVQFYQDHQNGVNNYRLENRVAVAGTNKVALPILAESGRIYHECSVIFLTPGQYKVDIQCSTSEPVDDIFISRDPMSIEYNPDAQCGVGEVNHVWRFIPPIAISVAD